MTESTTEKIERLQGELTAAQAQLDRERMARGGKGADNPFADPITPEQVATLLKTLGTARCRVLAAEAGKRLDGADIGSPFKGRDYIRAESTT